MADTDNRIEYPKYNKAHFKEVCGYLDDGQELTLEMVGHVFGPNFYLIMLYTLMDAQEAARSIQLASMRVQAAMMQKAMEAQAAEDEAPVPHSPLVTEA
jgi:hypothetical protein